MSRPVGVGVRMAPRLEARYGGGMSDPTALPNFPPPPDEHPLRGRILDVIQDLGLAPAIDDDGDVAFTVDGQSMFARCQDGDLPIMRVFGQWLIGDHVPDDLMVRLQRCNDFTLQLISAKTGLSGDNLVVTSEHVITPGADLSVLFQVSVNVVLQAVALWNGSFLEQSPNQEHAPNQEQSPSWEQAPNQEGES